MRYFFQRVVHNTCRWTKPSDGRLGSKLDGGYLKDKGFAHEDWNFKKDVCADGFARGYGYYKPKNKTGNFRILFATYDKFVGWALVGYYADATFDPEAANFPKTILRRRAEELKDLETTDSLGRGYRGYSVNGLMQKLRSDAQYYRWRVRPDEMHLMQSPIAIPTPLCESFGKYFTSATEISQKQSDAILKIARSLADRPPEDDYNDGGDVEFPEGKEVEKKHKGRERSKKLIRDAKARFMKKHGTLFCEACDFNFETTYGPRGQDFIEVHHVHGIHSLPKTGGNSKLSDVALVCSNCHRIIHTTRPWLDIEAMRKLIRTYR